MMSANVDSLLWARSLLSLMRRRIVRAFLVSAAITIAGCKQGDGALPAKTGEIPNRLNDLKRDLESVTAGEQQAVQDLADDLQVFTEEPEGAMAVRALSTTVSGIVVKRALNDDTLTRLSTLLWMTAAARELSERQMDGLKDDMRTLMTSIGASQQDANLAAGRVGDVQKAVTLRTRRWYERY